MKLTLLLSLFAVFLNSCRKNPGQPSWDIDALAPLAKTEVGINQLLPDSILSTNPDHSLDIVYNSEVYNFTLKDFLTVHDTTISSTYFMIPGAYNPGQMGPTVTSQTAMSLQVVQLKTLIIKSGKVKFEVFSKVKGKTKMTYTIPKATKNGIPFSATLNIPAGTVSTDGYLSSVFDLSDYSFDLRGQSGNNYNTIVTVLTAGIDPQETAPVTVALTDYMTLSSTFEEVIPEYAKGYFGNTVIEVPPGTTKITAFDQIISGNLKLESLKMKFSLENSIGVDASADIHYLNALNQHTTSAVSLSNNSIVGVPVHLNRAVENPFSTSVYSVSLDNSNSNAKSFFEILPDELGYAMKVEVNPLGNLSGGNDFAYLEKGLKAFVDLEIPLSIISDKLTFIDSAAFKLDDFATLHKIISGNLILNVTNGFPFEGVIRVMEISEDGTLLDSLFSTNTITAGPLDANLKVPVPAKSKLLIPLNQTHIDHLLKTKKLAFTIQLSTLPENQYVKLYSDYKMGIKVVGDFKYRLKTENMFPNTNSFFRLCLIAALSLIGFTNTRAQFTDHFSENNRSKFSSVGTYGEFNIGSNAIDSRLIKSYYNSKFIDEDLKDEVGSKLDQSLNRFGGDANTGIYFEHYSDSLLGCHSGYWISYDVKNHIDAMFGKDVFDLYFRGNKMFAGSTANLENFNLNFLSYRQLQFGWMEKLKCGNGTWNIGLGLAYIQGLQNIHASTAPGSGLYTDAEGESLAPSIFLNIKQSDTLAQRSFSSPGTGGSIDLFLNYTEPENKSFTFEMSGLGKIFWNKNSPNMNIDTAFIFEGVDIKNLIHIDSSDYAGYDSTYLSKFVKNGSGSYETMLPALFHLSFEKTIVPHKLKWRSGIRYRLMAGYSAEVYSTLSYYICKKWKVSGTISKGGYTDWAGGISSTLEIGKGLFISAGSNYTSSYLKPTGTNESGFLQIRKRF